MPGLGATRGLLQIGDVAERTGLSLRTVRHYEEVGLLPPAERSAGGFRLYTDGTVQRLLVVKQLKPLGFSLEQMRDVLDVLDGLADPGVPPGQRRRLLAALAEQRRSVVAAVDELQARVDAGRDLERALTALLAP